MAEIHTVRLTHRTGASILDALGTATDATDDPATIADYAAAAQVIADAFSRPDGDE